MLDDTRKSKKRHSHEGGNLGRVYWIPAFAGMTTGTMGGGCVAYSTRLIFTLVLTSIMILTGCGEPSAPQKESSAASKGESSKKEHTAATPNASEEKETTFLEWSVLPVSAPAFDKLTNAQKAALYALFRKRHQQVSCSSDEDYCRVRRILEEVMQHPGGISMDIRRKIKDYLAKLWVFGSNVNPLTGVRVRPTFIPGELGAATQLAIRNGADIDVSEAENVPLEANNIEQLEALLAEIRPFIFSNQIPTAHASSADTDEPNSDGAATGAAKENNTHSIPTDSVTRAENSSEVSAKISEAASGAPEVTLNDEYLFIEDQNFKSMLQKLMAKADFFDKKVREVGGTKSTAPRVTSPVLQVAHLIDVGNGIGPLISDSDDLLGFGVGATTRTPSGEMVRTLWLNVNEAFERRVGERISSAFSGTRSAAERRNQRRQLVSVAYHALRQLVGFGDDGTENKPEQWLAERLGEHHAPITQLRADLAALYLAFNEELPSTGLVPDKETRRALVDEYLHSPLEAIAVGINVTAHAHLLARMVVLNYLVSENVVSVNVDGDGKLRLHIADYAQLRTPIIQLLGRVRNIRFFGDGGKAAALMAQYAFVQGGWKKRLQDQFEVMAISRRYLMLLPVLEATGRIKDATHPPAIQLRMPKTIHERYIYLSGI